MAFDVTAHVRELTEKKSTYLNSQKAQISRNLLILIDLLGSLSMTVNVGKHYFLRIRNAKVTSSIPVTGTKKKAKCIKHLAAPEKPCKPGLFAVCSPLRSN